MVEYIFMHEIGAAVAPWLEWGQTREAFMQFIIQLDKNRAFYQAAIRYEGQNSLGELMENFSVEALQRYMRKNGRISESGLYSVDTMSRYFGMFLRFVMTQYLRSRSSYTFDELMQAYDLLIDHSPRQLLDGTAVPQKTE